MLRRVCGIVIDSNVEMPGFECVDAQSQLSFEIDYALPKNESWHWFRSFSSSDSALWLSFGRNETNYIVRFHGIADYHIAVTDTKIQCFPQPQTSLHRATFVFVNSVIPLALSLRGEHIFHASVVVRDAEAIAFLGESGIGKSTLAVSFARAGSSAMADDCLYVQQNYDEFWATPSYPAIRLWADSANELAQVKLTTRSTCDSRKQVLYSENFSGIPARLRGLYILDHPAKDVLINRMPSSTAVTALTQHLYRLAEGTKETLSTEFSFLCDLVSKVPVFSIAYPRNFGQLFAVRDAVWRSLRGTA